MDSSRSMGELGKVHTIPITKTTARIIHHFKEEKKPGIGWESLDPSISRATPNRWLNAPDDEPLQAKVKILARICRAIGILATNLQLSIEEHTF